MKRMALAVALLAFGASAAGGSKGDARGLWRRASGLMAQGRYAEAEKACLNLLALHASPLDDLRATASLADVYARLGKRDKMAIRLAEAEAHLTKTKDPATQARVYYLKAVAACERDDYKTCLAALRQALGESEEPIVWANRDDAFFMNLRLLDDTANARQEFLKLTDLRSYDKALRKQIADLCARARGEKKRVLIYFDGQWCPWCRDMTQCLKKPQVVAALEGYLMLTIDVGRFDKHQVVMEEVIDRKEIPALVILDGDGAKVVHLNCADFEDRERRTNDPARLAVLLRRHQAEAPPLE